MFVCFIIPRHSSFRLVAVASTSPFSSFSAPCQVPFYATIPLRDAEVPLCTVRVWGHEF